jgi:hypothetical protein
LITPLAADIIGLIGSVIFIGAFIYANMTATLNKRVFNALNLIGAALLLISLSVHFNLAAVVLEVAWGVIALFGLVAALRKKE